jgi:Lrp/AsnC family transcriptional regulator, leucine-responsive regulatory protein
MAKWPIEGRSPLVPKDQRHAARSSSENELLDPINLLLLAELQEDARVSVAELGRRINLSAPAVAERLGRLERGGVILGYRAEVDPKALGFPLAAVVRVRPGPGQLPRIPEIARDTPEVVQCRRITGEDCFILELHLRSIDDLEEILDRFVLCGQTTTSIVHSSPVPRRALPLDE